MSIDVWNGFANRILWAAVRRTRWVPFPQPLSGEVVRELSERLGEILVHVWSRGQVALHPEAARKWAGIYGALTEDRPGALGAITSRAEALTLRLALLYSRLDPKATMIEVAHLRAALAVWDYCNDLACYLFGEADIDPQANTIIDALAKGDKTQTEINDLFSGHLSKTQEVYCEGRLKLDSWTGRDGREQSGLSVAANRVSVLGKIGFDPHPRGPPGTEAPVAHHEFEGHGRTEQDLPF
jgi:hypothetical protein